MSAPQETIPGCPPGLEYLTQIDQLLVHQQVEIFEGMFKIEMVLCRALAIDVTTVNQL